MSRGTLLIVDDFYSDPDAVRTLALNSGYRSSAALNYPGWQSKQPMKTDALKVAFEGLLDTEIDVDAERFAWGSFRMINARTGAVTKVHADSIVDWAAMVYLTPDAPLDIGTGFFRHRETGLPGPPDDETARRLGYNDAEDFDLKVARRDMADFDKWELVGQVAPVYNRLVLFRGCELYHAPLGGCGTEPSDARITHSFFFNEKRPLPGADRQDATSAEMLGAGDDANCG